MEGKFCTPENSNNVQNTFVTYKVTNIEIKLDPVDQKYPCPICNIRYDIRSHLIQHLHSHRRDRPGEIFNILYENADTDKNKIFKCEKCLKILASERGLRIHSDKCLKKKRFSNKRKKPIRMFDIIKKGNFKHDNQASLQKINRNSDIKMHGNMNNFSKEGNLVKYGKKIPVLKQNFETQCDSKSEISSISCEISESDCDDPSSDEYHLKIDGSNRTTDPIKCELCNKIFLSKSARRVHYRRHTEEKPFDCEVCGKKYVTSAGLKYHYLSHVKASETGNEQCTLTSSSELNCNKTIEELDSHELDLIDKDKSTFSCKSCPQVFSSEKNLAQHRLIHYCSQTFKCDVCEKLFLYYNQLKRHSKTHLKKSN